MFTIYKYPIPVVDEFSLSLPGLSEILAVQVQRGEPQLWAKVYVGEPCFERRFQLFGTGHPIPDQMCFHHKHIGTFQLEGGSLVYHLFEDLCQKLAK